MKCLYWERHPATKNKIAILISNFLYVLKWVALKKSLLEFTS